MKNGETPAFQSIMTDLTTFHYGLTKREYFAGLAMQGLLGSGRRYTDMPKQIAEAAVKQADELLKQLEETK